MSTVAGESGEEVFLNGTVLYARDAKKIIRLDLRDIRYVRRDTTNKSHARVWTKVDDKRLPVSIDFIWNIMAACLKDGRLKKIEDVDTFWSGDTLLCRADSYISSADLSMCRSWKEDEDHISVGSTVGKKNDDESLWGCHLSLDALWSEIRDHLQDGTLKRSRIK